MRVHVAAAVVTLCAVLPLGSAQAQSARAERGAMCDSLHASALRRADSIIAIPRGQWRPEPANLQERLAIDEAHVVFQVRVDTTGRPEPRTFRVRRSRGVEFERFAQQQLAALDFDPLEAVPGCRVVSVVTVPLRVSR